VIPDKPGVLRATFANALHMIAARGRLVLVLDALNQIKDSDGAGPHLAAAGDSRQRCGWFSPRFRTALGRI
jgi:hypothetical protein